MTIGDMISKVKADEQAKADADNALKLATQAFRDATDMADTDDRALANALGAIGQVFVVQPDGTAAIYAPDGAGSYHITIAKPVDTPAVLTPVQ